MKGVVGSPRSGLKDKLAGSSFTGESRVAGPQHFVQFYEADSFLTQHVADFIACGLEEGELGLVIATPGHRRAIEAQLRQHGIDVGAATLVGEYIALDAAETLSRFMVNGSPDASLFRRVIGEQLQQRSGSVAGVRAFGEMVALLWAQGKGAAAIRLEQLWDELCRQYSLTLLCAYPLRGFAGESNATSFANICEQHTRVFPAESYAAEIDPDKRLRQIALLQQRAGSLNVEIAEREVARDRLEQVVQERTAQLEQVVAELDAFSYSVSHDLRSPLRTMQTYAKSLLEDYGERLDTDAATRLERIERASTRLDQLVRDVLSFTKIGQGKIELEPVWLMPFIEDLLHQDPAFQEDRGCISVEVKHEVLAHPAYLAQCLGNLIGNALKFVPTGRVPAVRLRSERFGDKVRVSVTDNGVGIKPEHYDRIFRLFGRVYPEQEFPGTGIGLAIVKRAVSRMGGETGFSSEPGVGTTFWFALLAASSSEEKDGIRT